MTIEREDMEEILQKVEKVQSQLSEIRTSLQSLLGEDKEFGPPDWLEPRLRVWKRIVDKGEVVTRGELYKIINEISGIRNFINVV